MLSDSKRVDLIVDVTAGTGALPMVMKAIKQGKIVVSSNKGLLAENFLEIFEAARENGSLLGLEAATGGACDETELIEHLRERAVSLREIVGIFNGTTNYILTLIERKVQSLAQQRASLSDIKDLFADAQQEAIDEGATEPDPTLDMTAQDPAYKAAILAGIGFGLYYPVNDPKNGFFIEGLVKQGVHDKQGSVYKFKIPGQNEEKIWTFLLDTEDFLAADEMGYKIRLVGRLKRLRNNQLDIRVHLAFVSKDHPIAQTEGLQNIFLITDERGRRFPSEKANGAGPDTAKAIARDVNRIYRGRQTGKVGHYELTQGEVYPIEQTKQRYYLHLETAYVSPEVIMNKISRNIGAPKKTVDYESAHYNFYEAYWVTPLMTEEKMREILELLRLDSNVQVARAIRVFEGKNAIESLDKSQDFAMIQSL